MRMLLKWESGLEATNEAIQTGKIAELNELINKLTQPEAAYFCTENGRRTSYTFFDMSDTSQICDSRATVSAAQRGGGVHPGDERGRASSWLGPGP
jgi:hypothetical protein